MKITHRGARLENMSTSALDRRFFIFRMEFRFHGRRKKLKGWTLVAINRSIKRKFGRCAPLFNAYPPLTSQVSARFLELNRQLKPDFVKWAATACAYFGEEANELAELALPLLDDENCMVRIRAAEFLGGIGRVDPRATIINVVNSTDHPVEQLIALNSAAYFHENIKTAFPFDASDFDGVKGEPARRIQ